MKRTGLVYHEDYLLHHAGSLHPESPERLQSIMNYLAETKLLTKLNRIEPYPAAIDWIATIHSRDYIESIRRICEDYGHSNLDADTAVCPDSYRVALLAVGGALAAADAMMNGEIDNAFCAVRPPGHHAEKNRAMGFCLFNNIAILARYLQQKYQLEKILIVDWDVHHGNGTQNAFYDDATVFYFSIHQWPHYPGTGLQTERGIGIGEGFTLNIPLAGGHGNEDYIRIFQNDLAPVVKAFKPNCILISAGFDGHWDDPLAGMQLTEAGYGQLTEVILEFANEFCGGRIISLLEGGYNLEMLAKSVATHIDALRNGGK
ncbi:MAG TPA: histone deacetylase [bacterium]